MTTVVYQHADLTEVVPLENIWRNQIESLSESSLRITFFRLLPSDIIDMIDAHLPRLRAVCAKRGSRSGEWLLHVEPF